MPAKSIPAKNSIHWGVAMHRTEVDEEQNKLADSVSSKQHKAEEKSKHLTTGLTSFPLITGHRGHR